MGADDLRLRTPHESNCTRETAQFWVTFWGLLGRRSEGTDRFGIVGVLVVSLGQASQILFLPPRQVGILFEVEGNYSFLLPTASIALQWSPLTIVKPMSVFFVNHKSAGNAFVLRQSGIESLVASWAASQGKFHSG